MNRKVLLLALPAAALLAMGAAATGGWATITVEDLPDSLAAAEPAELAFTLRQHGETPLRDRAPVVEATKGTGRERFRAAPNGEAGGYVARVTLPSPGEWAVTIDADFGDSRVALVPIVATGKGVGAPTPTPRERGRRLFVAKGCLSCHVHADVAGSGRYEVGPNLTKTPLPADYLARALADPTIIPRRVQATMPDLDLKPGEIESLVAFLKGGALRADR